MIQQRLHNLREQINKLAQQSSRNPDAIRLIAVSKTRPLTDVEQAIAAGQIDFGANTVQDAMTKLPFVNDSKVQWHFIGHLQSKKAKAIPGSFQWIHSVDSLKLAGRLSTAMQNTGMAAPLNALIQVNVSGEASKSGLMPDQVESFVEQALQADYPLIAWRGLMTIGVKADASATRKVFAGLRELQQRIQHQFSLPQFDQLSMGMSGDYAEAIAEGATMIRIGAAIFGPR